MKCSQLENKANKMHDPEDISKYKKQHNYVVKLNNQSKQEHFDSFNPFLYQSFLGMAVSCTFLTSIHLVAQKMH